MNTEQVVINDITFQLNPLPALKAMKLDKKVLSLLVPVLGGMENFKLDSEIDMKSISSGISTALSNMSDIEYESLILDLLSTVVYIYPGKPPMQITQQVLNDEFRGKLTTVYKLLYKVMEYNKFSPFELVGGGLKILGIGTSNTQSTNQNQNGQK